MQKRTVLGTAAVFAAAAVVFATQESLARHWPGGPLDFGSVLLVHAIGWGIWGLLTPLVVIPVTRRFPLHGGALGRELAGHLLAGFALAALQTFLVAAVTAFLYYGISPLATRDIFLDRAYTAFALNLLIYAVIVGVTRARTLAADARERERAAAELETRAARAELALLYAQLQPHFLFNALNSITELIHSDPVRAAAMIRALGELLRAALASAGSETTTLSNELRFIRRYVEVQQMRFERFGFELSVDESAGDALVPPLLLQPLVENAIQHTVGRRGSGRAALSIDRRLDRLHITVADDGAGFGTEPAGESGGLGLASTRARLDRLYGDRYTMRLANGPIAGATVSLELPFVSAAAPG
jgi:two-component system, LytTR family, sensor kinase